MQKFRLRQEIHKPVEQVYRLFTDREKMILWQPGLLENEALQNKDGVKRYKLVYRIGNRSMVMTETILKDVFPGYDVEYRLKGIVNTVNNVFTANGPDKTIWISDNEFRFRWLMKLVGVFMKKGLENQAKIIMKNFKNFAEKSK
jgi:hypothetical protein